jgi:hypothetical protein
MTHGIGNDPPRFRLTAGSLCLTRYLIQIGLAGVPHGILTCCEAGSAVASGADIAAAQAI